MGFARFVVAGVRAALRGSRRYWVIMGTLALVFGSGALAYAEQLDRGLSATALNDHVPWGVYIANFTFLDGIAASTGLVYIFALVFRRKDAQRVALLGSGIAVAACVSCLLFVVVDIGRPLAAWHLVPGLGSLNWPRSMLAWDVVALNGYLVLCFAVPTYVLYRRYQGRQPSARVVVPAAYLSIGWALLIQAIIAFLYAANVGRPFWHSGLLGPRFLASSFTAGSSLMILAFHWIGHHTRWPVQRSMIELLALVASLSLLGNLFMLAMELFTELYQPTAHSASARYLFLGLDGHHGLVPWIWTAIGLQVLSAILLFLNRFRRSIAWLTAACITAIVGVWIEKGMGLVVPGFLPTSLGVIHEYLPNAIEIRVSLGIWALGFMIFGVLAKAALHVQGLDGPRVSTSSLPPAGYTSGLSMPPSPRLSTAHPTGSEALADGIAEPAWLEDVVGPHERGSCE